MEKKKRDDKKPKQRFKKDRDGEFILENYATKKTAVLAEARGMTVKQVENLIYRNKTKGKPCKDPDYLSKIRSESGKKGGRPRKNS